MSDSIADRVTGILEDAERGSDELGALEEVEDLPSELEESGLAGTAEEASELIEDEDADDLLEALGLDELEDGTKPDSLLAAIAQGSAEQVGDLRVLVKLAKVAEADDEELSTEVGELREAVEERGDVLEEDEANEDGSVADKEDETDGEAEESLAESAAGAVQDAVGGGEGDGDDEEGLLEAGLESAMRSRLEGFGDELDEARARLDALRDEETDDTDREDADREDADEADHERGNEESEDTLLGSDSRPRSRGTMHSTMAPSPSKRADMGTSTRHSTMPDR